MLHLILPVSRPSLLKSKTFLGTLSYFYQVIKARDLLNNAFCEEIDLISWYLFIYSGMQSTAAQDCAKWDVIAQAQIASSIDELVQRLELTDEDRQEIETNTQDQNESEIWHKVRKGRITASNWYRVYTRVETLKKHPHTDMSALVASFVNPPNLTHLPQINKGKETEKEAIAAAYRWLEQHHHEVKLIPCGLFVDEKHPFIGATPDSIIECACHGKSVLEVKCPSTAMEQLQYLDESMNLREKSAYYGQVQGQMHVTDTDMAHFFVYSGPEKFAMDIIFRDKKFCQAMVGNIDVFFRQFLGPTLLQTPVHKIAKLC